MAQNSITIQLTVDDKGTLRQVSKEADKARKGYDGVAKSSAEADRNTKGAARASSNATKNFSKMQQGLTSGLVPAYATLAANLFAVSAAFNFLREASDFQRLLEGQEALTMATGIAYESLARSIQEAADSQITFSEASRSAAIGISAGLSADQLTQLSAAANTVSRILGRDLVDSYNRLIRGVTKAEPELLDELGIILRLADASERYAEKLKLNVNELTTFQRTQAVTEDVLRQVEERYGKVNDILDPTGSALNKLAVAFENLSKQIGVALVGPANFIAEVLTTNVQAAAAVFGIFASSILGSVIPSLEDLSKVQKEGVKNLASARKAWSSTTNAVKEFTGVSGLTAKAVVGLSGTMTAGEAAFKAFSASVNLATAALLRFITFVSRVIGIIGLALVAWELLGSAVDFIKEKLNLTDEEVEKFNKTLEGLSGSLSFATKDFERIAFRIEELGISNLTDQITILGNAASSIQTKQLDSLVSSLRAATFEAPGLEGRRFIRPDLDISLIEEAEEDLQNYLESVARVLPEVGEIISSLEGDFLQLSNDQLASIYRVIDGYREQLAIQERIKQLSEEESQARRALNRSFSPSPIQRYSRVLRETLEFERKNLSNIRDRASLVGELSEQQKEEIRLIENKVAKLEEVSTKFNNLLQQEISFLENKNSLMVEEVRLQGKVTLAAQRQAALLSEKLSELKIDEKRLQIASIRARVQEGASKDEKATAELAIQNLEREITLDEAKLDLLRQQNNELLQLRNNATQAFEGALQTSLRDIITGQTSSIKEAVVKIAQATLESIATSLSQMMATRVSEALFGSKAQDMKNALREGAQSIEDAIVRGAQKAAGILSGDTTQETAQAAISREGTQMSVFQRPKSYLFGGPSDRVRTTSEGGATRVEGRQVEGVFSRFVEGLKGLFSKDAPFLQSLGNIFAGGLQGFGTLFSDILGGLFGGGSGGGGGLFGTLAKGALSLIPGVGGIAAMLPFKEGGISTPSGKVPGYAVGGIAKGPTQGYPAILHGTEAVVPLPNGKSIPVEPRGSMATNNVEVNVNIDNQGNAQTQTQMDDQQAGNLGRAISVAVQEELQRQKRPGGILSPYGAA